VALDRGSNPDPAPRSRHEGPPAREGPADAAAPNEAARGFAESGSNLLPPSVTHAPSIEMSAAETAIRVSLCITKAS
jgi:hypothetical protein